jgi:hypothetical protein
MSYQEKRTLASLVSTLLINLVYGAAMLQRQPQGNGYSPETFRFWGAFFLILIPVSIFAKIALHIIFSILNTIVTRESEPGLTDERDHLIELKATQIALYVFAVGFLLAMVSLLVDTPPSTMFIVLLLTGITSEITSDAVQFFLYRRGF